MARYGVLLTAAALWAAGAAAQSDTRRNTPAEVELARLLWSDSRSRTVSYLPRGYWFGFGDRSQGSLVLVKDGPRNYLLRDGTHEVYLLRSEGGVPALQRLDSSVFSGDNFNLMAFLRKDTLYQYGGYGFWNTRDFFMRFRPAGRDWEFLTGGAGLPNELNYHFYDPAADAFYVMGSLSTSHHPFPRKIFVDSVYRYDFTTRRWTALGPLQDDFDEFDARGGDPMSLCFSPFGLIDTRTSNLRLFDIPGNRILTAGSRLADTVMTLGRNDRLFDPVFRVFLYLGDTLHGLQGDRGQVRHVRLRVSEADFDPSPAQAMYRPVASPSGQLLPDWAKWVALISVPVGGLAWALRRRRRGGLRDDTHAASVAEAGMAGPVAAEVMADGAVAKSARPLDDIAFFRSQLSPAELDLFEVLLRQSQAGVSTDSQTLNKVLGVSGKPDSIQKARRSVTMNHINDTFRKTLKRDAPLLVRERDAVDKRAFVYRIDPQFLGLFDRP